MRSVLVVIGIMLVALSVQAQTVVTFKVMPAGHDGQVQGVGRARYYLLDEYLKLSEFDDEIFKLRQDVPSYQQIEKDLIATINEKDVIIKTLESDKKILADRGLRLEDVWKRCEKDLISTTTVPIWPYVIGIVGGVLGITGVGLYVGSQLNHK